jgi:O-antigen/teichoic acid export membrane protein
MQPFEHFEPHQRRAFNPDMHGENDELNSDETLRVPHTSVKEIRPANGWLCSVVAALPPVSRLMPVAYSCADQALAAGANFLANVMLARSQTKEEYGKFALSYSLFTFLAGLHNSAILEPCTVYGSGRYRNRFPEYLRLMVRVNAFVGLLLMLLVLLVCLALSWAAPQYASRPLVGLGITVGVLLSGTFLRRVFYVQRQSWLAAQASLIYFVTLACALWFVAKIHLLNGFTVFLIFALGWVAAGLGLGKKLSLGQPTQSFLESEPDYWREHWKYSKWVLSTTFVFQFAMQGYYWLVAGFLTVKEVADLRATYMLVAPVDQVYIALSFLLLPALATRSASGRQRDFFFFLKLYGMGVLLATGLFALVVRVAGKPVMHWLYAGKFDDLAPLLYLLALSPIFMGVASAAGAALNAAEKPKLVFYGYLCSGTITFLCGIPLVIRFGLRGAVYGLLLSAGTCSVALLLGFFLSVVKTRPVQPAIGL